MHTDVDAFLKTFLKTFLDTFFKKAMLLLITMLYMLAKLRGKM